MFLVQTGKRSKSLVKEALGKRQHLPILLTILGDIADVDDIPTLEEYRQGPDPTIVRAADDAIEVIKLRQQRANSRKGAQPHVKEPLQKS